MLLHTTTMPLIASAQAHRPSGHHACARFAAPLAAAAASTQRCRQHGAVPQQARQQQQQQQHLAAGLQQRQHQQQRRGVTCRATVDDADIQELVAKMEEQTPPPPPPAQRPQLAKAFSLIDAANADDPSRVTVDGESVPYRLAYSRWLTEWVLKLDPNACDEVLLLARGRSIQSWKLADIKRDDYAPNTPGQRQWEMDRKKWLANRLLDAVKEAGYDEGVTALVSDIMMGKAIPDPRDVRLYDLIGVFGMVNYRTLKGVCILQTLDDAEALLFLDKNFGELLNRMPPDEVAATCKRQLSRLSQRGIVTVLKQKWSPVQERLLQKVLPVPFKFSGIMMEVEGMAAASTHPGDWRYNNFDYE